MKQNIFLYLLFLVFIYPHFGMAQKIEIQETQVIAEPRSDFEKSEKNSEPETGKGAARKFFESDSKKKSESSSESHYLMFGATVFFDSDAYRWGPREFEDPAEWGLGVTYRFGEWVNSTDFLVRIEYQFYDLDGNENPQKLSFVPLLVFPDARSEFPLYFGLGAGAGVFTKQIGNESHLSLDYQVFLGLRFFDLLENVGFFLESGLKNHFNLLSSGQLNSVYLSFGSVFTF